MGTKPSSTSSTTTQRLEVGQTVPNFHGVTTSQQSFSLNQYIGQNIVLYFYPKDLTPGCTTESLDFKKLHAEFFELNTVIFGISRDDIPLHEKFKSTHCLPFELISDEDEAICKLFDVIHPKNMYGREVIGVERSTFLINAEGVLQKEWRKVSVQGHAQLVLEAVKALHTQTV
jgi:thioredoxin-dependent peroxiredoxin